jgi:hypothetical protein
MNGAIAQFPWPLDSIQKQGALPGTKTGHWRQVTVAHLLAELAG